MAQTMLLHLIAPTLTAYGADSASAAAPTLVDDKVAVSP